MIQEILGAVLISTPIIYLIYLTKQNNSIINKLVIRGSDVSFSKYQNEPALVGEYENFISYVIQKEKKELFLILKCENYSNQLIRYFADLNQSFIEIRVHNNAHKSLSYRKDSFSTIKHQLLPYSTKKLICCSFPLDEVLALAKQHNNEVVLDFKIALKYGVFNKKCIFETSFSDKANLKFSSNDKNEITYNYQGKAVLLK